MKEASGSWTPALHAEAPRYVENPTDEDYAAAARFALRENQLALAIEQISAALALRPWHVPHLRLCDEVLASARRPLELVQPSDGEMFFGSCAVRARLLARLRRFDEALGLLFAVTAFRPELPFLDWARGWVDGNKAAKRLRPESVAAGLVTFSEAVRFGVRDHLPTPPQPLAAGLRRNLESALHVAAAVQRRHPASSELRAARARLLRRFGQLTEAQRCLEETETLDWATAIERAALAATRGNTGERVRFLMLAVELRPDEPSSFYDLAQSWLDEGELERALDVYRRALAIRDLGWVRRAIAEIEADASAYETRLCDPLDPVARVIRAASARASESGAAARLEVRVRADRPLAPSARVAFEHASAQRGYSGTIQVSCEREVRPGPLWQLELEPSGPVDTCIRAASELANSPYAWEAWCRRAAALAAGFSKSEIDGALRAMVRPPAPPEGVDAVRWVHAFQIALALLVAHAPQPAEARFAAFLPLLDGIDDWSLAAALLGLRALAETRPEQRDAIVSALGELLPDETEPLFPAATALAVSGLALAADRMPYLRLRARIRRELAEVEREPDASDVDSPVAESRQGLK